MADANTSRVTPAEVIDLATDVERLEATLRDIKIPNYRKVGITAALRRGLLCPEDILGGLTVVPIGKV